MPTSPVGRSVPVFTLILYALWAAVLTAFVAAWVLMAVGDPDVAELDGFSDATLACVAVAVTARYYALRAFALMRSLAGLEREQAELRSVTRS